MRGFRSSQGLQVATGLILLIWPFLIWFGLRHNSLQWLLPLMALLLILRLYLARRAAGPMRFVIQGTAAAGIILCIASTLLRTHQLLLYWPVVVNGVMLGVFGGSLWTNMPLVERLARLREPELSPAGVRYTRRVTQVWCVFFIFNGVMALITTLYGNIKIWTLWNGMLAYMLTGIVMAGEWLVRRRVGKRETR